METKVCEELKEKFYCEKCNYTCLKKQHIKQHYLSKKHNKLKESQFENSIEPQNNIIKSFDCSCGNKYKDRTGLWKHKKKCVKEEFANEKVEGLTDLSFKKIIQLLLKEKEELENIVDKEKQVILELYKFIEHIGAIPSLVSYLEEEVEKEEEEEKEEENQNA